MIRCEIAWLTAVLDAVIAPIAAGLIDLGGNPSLRLLGLVSLLSSSV